ncbi:molybdate ABC transporter substrate-binding protein [Histidinibacterium lentulum]|uniref:Molybdate-binding protein ModA n=1 Tax=Histidinibacterium lentulum TaxID=2480588 RepID=A0A3N2QY15_9RHOB|nr:molybdate ABC transporter substrate-binding protein [Histidinibacterium lentulum]ROU00119.1 molybdate ABC transporter substrate-binding protein [Histidinibacterium lentulum]
MLRSAQVVAVALAWTVSGPATALAEEITVFAASSLTDAMAEIEERFEAATGHDLVVSLAGSSALARQIQQGAPADIFISASPDWMDALQADGLLEPGTRFDLLENSIVLITSEGGMEPVDIGPGFDLGAMIGDGPLAMALVDAVPAGIYGKAALESLGLWADVSGRVAQADNVRAALAFVSAGEAPFGIVYATDALAEETVSVVGRFPKDTHPPIVYPVAEVANRDSESAAAFMDYLRGSEAREVFERQGFVVLPD